MAAAPCISREIRPGPIGRCTQTSLALASSAVIDSPQITPSTIAVFPKNDDSSKVLYPFPSAGGAEQENLLLRSSRGLRAGCCSPVKGGPPPCAGSVRSDGCANVDATRRSSAPSLARPLPRAGASLSAG